MKILANDLRSGFILEFENSLWAIVKNPEHIKPGKGVAYVQVEMKNLFDSKKINKRFSSHQSLNKAYIEDRKIEYLYEDGLEVIFMDKDSLEHISIMRNMVQNFQKFLFPSIVFTAKIYESKVIDLIPPEQISLTVKETEVFMKSYRESPSYKSAITENNMRIMVPSYINVGDKVLVNSNDLKFIAKQ